MGPEAAATVSALIEGEVVANVLVMALSAPEAEPACGRAEAPIIETSTSSAAVAIFSINVRMALPSDHGIQLTHHTQG